MRGFLAKSAYPQASGTPLEGVAKSPPAAHVWDPVVRLAIDFEHSDRTWWESGGQELWDNIAESFDSGSVVVDESLARSWMLEAAKLPGWDAGPPHAVHPVLIREVNDDEDV